MKTEIVNVFELNEKTKAVHFEVNLKDEDTYTCRAVLSNADIDDIWSGQFFIEPVEFFNDEDEVIEKPESYTKLVANHLNETFVDTYYEWL